MGGLGAGGQEREHHNKTFIPSDEPFLADDDRVVPAVLGVPENPDDTGATGATR